MLSQRKRSSNIIDFAEIAGWFFGLIGKAWANVEDAFGVILWLVFIVIGLNWLIG